MRPTIPAEYAKPETPSRNEMVRQKRSRMFQKEKLRQQSLIPRLEKIEVEFVGAPGNATMILNKNLSTPHDVAKRE